MKKIMLAAGLLLSGMMNAQLVFSSAGNEISNGQVFEYSTFYEMPVIIYNESDTDTFLLQVRVDDLQNTTGDSFQLCFGGLCLTEINSSTVIPPDYTWIMPLEPGQSTPAGDHLWNTNPGDGVNYPMDVRVTFFRVDENGTFMQDMLTMTYRYNPQMGLEGTTLEKMGIRNLNTIVDATLNINSSEDLKMDVLNLNGQVVRSSKVNAGQQNIDVSELNQGVYIVRFSNDRNASAQVKVMKK